MDKLSGIKVKGGFYKKEIIFNFFSKEIKKNAEGKTEKNVLLSCIYGKNGSGKSSISRAIKQYACGVEEAENLSNKFSVSFLDINGFDISNVQDICKNTYVFNEDYIEENVRFNESGLETIVIFGKQLEFEDKEKELEKEIDVFSKKDIPAIEEKINKFENKKDIDSHLHKKDYIEKKLKSDWASKDSKIRGKRQNSTVNESLFDEIHLISKQKEEIDVDKLNEELDFKIKEIEKFNVAERSNEIVVEKSEHNIDKIKNILESQPSQPKLTNKEKEIFELVSSEDSIILKGKKYFEKNNDAIKCPFCLQ